MYYVIECEDHSPDALRSGDKRDNYCVITDKCPRTNMSHEERSDGWLGTTNDWYQRAHGEFESLESAREKCEKLGYERIVDRDDLRDSYISPDGTIEIYGIGSPASGPVGWVADLYDWLFYVDLEDDLEAQAEKIEQEMADDGEYDIDGTPFEYGQILDVLERIKKDQEGEGLSCMDIFS